MKDPNLITDFELTAVKDIPMLFCFEMLDFEKLPEGINGYYVSCDDEDWLTPAYLSEGFDNNFFGVVLSKESLPLDEDGIYHIDSGMDLSLFNSGSYSMAQYMRMNLKEE